LCGAKGTCRYGDPPQGFTEAGTKVPASFFMFSSILDAKAQMFPPRWRIGMRYVAMQHYV
jgi:hypothetical protein